MTKNGIINTVAHATITIALFAVGITRIKEGKKENGILNFVSASLYAIMTAMDIFETKKLETEQKER